MQIGRLKYDIFFKKIFHKKHILKAFLNTVLGPTLAAPIQDLSYKPTDFFIKRTSRLLHETKHDVIDVFCITEQQQRVLVELQKGPNKRVIPRFLDYQCRNYSSQFATGTDYKIVVPCYSICWFFDLQPPHKQIKEVISLHSDCNKTDWKFDWQIIALYPRNITPNHLKQQTIDALEEWLLLDVVDNLDVAKQIQSLLQTDEVKEAFEDLEISGLSEEQRRHILFEDMIMLEYDLFEKKVEETLNKQNLEMAKNLLDVLDIEIICDKTGLTRSEVEALQGPVIS